MELSEELNFMQKHVDIIRQQIDELRARLSEAKDAWPDHQIAPTADWHDRSEKPPIGQIWASDGLRVWLIRADGEGIPPGATAVKFWTTAYIPAPPSA
jgi:hypothetical protein